MTTVTVFILPGTSVWTVPSDWNNAANTIVAIGGGGGGSAGTSRTIGGPGGGGAAYAIISNVTLSPSSTVNVQIGIGGNGGATDAAAGVDGTDSIFNTSLNTLVAKGGGGGSGAGGSGHGGLAASCIPSTGAHSGGTGGGGGSAFVQEGAGGGGGGAGGSHGAGAIGGDGGGGNANTGGAGGGGSDGGSAGTSTAPGSVNGGAGGAAQDSTAGGAGGTVGSPTGGTGSHGSGGGGGYANNGGGAGGAGIGYVQTSDSAIAGPGGGSGGSGANAVTSMIPGAAGLYGGGGSGGKAFTLLALNSWSPGSAGANGIIIAQYTSTSPSPPPPPSGPKNYIERMQDRILKNGIADAWFVDAGLGYLGTAKATFSGAEHLGGKVVTGLADGLVIPPFIMPATGIFILPNPASNVNVGIGYNCDLQTLPLDVGEPSVQGKVKKIPYVDIRVHNTQNLQIGNDFNNLTVMKDLVVLNVSSALTGQQSQVVPALTDGDARTFLNPTYTVPGQYCIRQNLPLPATVLGVFPAVVQGDDR